LACFATIKNVEEMAKSDALESLRILRRFKDIHVPMWFYDEEV